MKEYKLIYKKESPMDGEDFTRVDFRFENPIDAWELYSLPLGNGYMGASVFGRVKTERIQITENSLSNPYTHRNGGMNSFLDLYIDFPHENFSNFSRYLSLNDAISGVDYVSDGVKYTRKYFTSYPDKVLVMRLEASEKGKLQFEITPKIPYIRDYYFDENDGMGKSGEVKKDGDVLICEGLMEYYQIKYEAELKVSNSDGNIIVSNSSIRVENASYATIILSVGTNYKLENRVFNEEDHLKKLSPYEHPHRKVSAILENASGKSYEELLANHLSDYHTLIERSWVDFGGEMPKMSTEEMLEDYKKGHKNVYLEELYFQYGRYLLISSSRPNTYPANLQGTWNKYESTAWSCGYWHNINVQMNYWPSFNTDLIECFEIYADYFEAFSDLTKKFADNYIRKAYPEKLSNEIGGNGWTICTGAWLYTLLEDEPFGRHSGPGTGAFTAKLFWDYYEFTQDKELLKERIFPCLLGASRFLNKTLIEKDGAYLVKMSASPENFHEGKAYQTTGCAFDQQMVYESFSDTIKAADILGIDNEEIREFKEKLNHLDHVLIGKSGQVKEYREEEYYGDIGEYHHRHISQLIGLYPGTSINANIPEFIEAAKTTLTLRGDESTGWSTAHKMNMWARTKDGEHTYLLLEKLLTKCTAPNLWDLHPPFQIDGNFGGTAGIGEMLIQSHEGYIDLLPAIPENWSNGSFKGLVARGNFLVSLDWKDKKASKIELLSRSGGVCKIKGNYKVFDNNNNEIKSTFDNGILSFDTTINTTYILH